MTRFVNFCGLLRFGARMASIPSTVIRPVRSAALALPGSAQRRCDLPSWGVVDESDSKAHSSFVSFRNLRFCCIEPPRPRAMAGRRQFFGARNTSRKPSSTGYGPPAVDSARHRWFRARGEPAGARTELYARHLRPAQRRAIEGRNTFQNATSRSTTCCFHCAGRPSCARCAGLDDTVSDAIIF